MPPFRSRANLTESPSVRLACFAIARGIRTARLFPHFAILESFRMDVSTLSIRSICRAIRLQLAARSPFTSQRPGIANYGDPHRGLLTTRPGRIVVSAAIAAGTNGDAVFDDVNNDGGTDILITNNNGPARLLLNTAPQRGHWLMVKLEGVHTNRSAYGSVVEPFRKDGTSVRRWVRGDGSYLAANDPRVHFGLGKAPQVHRIQVRWLGGACESWKVTAIDRIMTLREGTGEKCPALPAGSGN